MARSARFLSLLPALLLIYLCNLRVAESKKLVAARKADIPYIKCEVCEEIVKNLNRLVQRKRDEKAPKKLTELEIIEITEKVCNVKKDEGDWIQWLDIVEEGDKLKLVEQKSVGECNSDCKTVQKACEEVMGDHDTDVAELLFGGDAKRAKLSKLLCRDLSKACVKKPPPLPKDREPGEEFVAKEEKEIERDRLMRSMEGMPGGGRGMKMYHRDDLMKGGIPGMDGFEAGDDDDEDEEDEDSAADGGSGRRPAETSGQVAGEKEPLASGDGGALGKASELAESLRDGAQKAFGAAKDGAQQAYKAAAEGANAATEWLGGLLGKEAKEEQVAPGKGAEL